MSSEKEEEINNLSQSEYNTKTSNALTNLKILAKIKAENKVQCEDGQFIIDEWTYTQSVRRWWNKDSRKITLDLLENFINETFTLIDQIYSNEFSQNKDSNISADLPKEELLSIVVNPTHQGEGHAENLFKALCSHFGAEGASRFSIVVGSNLVRAHAFYTKMGCVPVKEIQVHKGADSVVYVKELSE